MFFRINELSSALVDTSFSYYAARFVIQAGPEAWYPGAGIFGWTWGRITTSQIKSNKSQLETRGAGSRQRRLREAWAQNVQD